MGKANYACSKVFFTMQQTCPECQGEGKIIKDRCTECRGEGRVYTTKTLSVKIPAGVDNGDNVRLTGKGEAGHSGGPTGDLIHTDTGAGT